MKNVKLILLSIISIFTISSCSTADSWLIKNTGLSSGQLITIGVSVKDRASATVKEINDAKAKNKASGKGVINVSPVDQQPTTETSDTEKQYSIFGNIPYVSALLNLF